jgi:threonine dehydrogenase-like Zn-dependent dehydrogenase
VRAALSGDGADLLYEVSGSPMALDQAIQCAGFGGRVVVGSWYGDKDAPLHLGGRFHRGRVQVLSSQVSTIAPTLSGRWNKARRFDVAWRMLAAVRPSRFITHRFPIQEAADAYALLDRGSDAALQVVFAYR